MFGDNLASRLLARACLLALGFMFLGGVLAANGTVVGPASLWGKYPGLLAFMSLTILVVDAFVAPRRVLFRSLRGKSGLSAVLALLLILPGCGAVSSEFEYEVIDATGAVLEHGPGGTSSAGAFALANAAWRVCAIRATNGGPQPAGVRVTELSFHPNW